MTAVVFAAGLAAGLTVGAAATYRHMRHLVVRCDRHDYRKVELSTAQWRTVVTKLDSMERELRRERASKIELRESVGDLLDTVNARDRQIARLRRTGPLPVYGIHRARITARREATA